MTLLQLKPTGDGLSLSRFLCFNRVNTLTRFEVEDDLRLPPAMIFAACPRECFLICNYVYMNDMNML